MLLKAKEKFSSRSEEITFIQRDITLPWHFGNAVYDLITFSLILEHIKDLDEIFQQAYSALKSGGYVYVGELHPYKQYTSTKARFNIVKGQQVLKSYTHHISEFISKAKLHGFNLLHLNEYFDEKEKPPRILSLLFTK